ncbi:MAG: phosphate ABC transporter permease PstA [Armatimonadota bacterium]
MNKAKKQKLIFFLLGLSTLFVIIPVIAIIYFLISRGLPAINWNFLTSMPENGMRDGGIYPAIIGTLYLMTFTLIFAVPVGVFSAIYLTEYAKKGKITRFIRLAIINLAGVPSIVYGLFGYGFFVLFILPWIGAHFGQSWGKSILAGSMTLALMILPVVITASEEALLTVPQSFRYGSLALGATKWQTIWKVVLPNSAGGIITGVILGVSRAAGETAPIMFTAAAYFLPRIPDSPLKDCMALPYHLYVIATEMPDPPVNIQWGTALVLLTLVLGMNLIATIIRARFRRSRNW